MTEESSTQESAEATQAESAATDPDINVRQSKAFKGLEKEASRYKSEASKLEQELAKLREAEEQRKIASLEEEKNWEQLKAEYDSKLQAKDAEIGAIKAEIEQSKIDAALRDAGITDRHARLGRIVEYNTLEERPPLDEWIDKMRTDEPDAFKAPAVPSAAPRAGTPDNAPADNSLKARLVSKDPKVAQAAREEQFNGIMSGKLDPNWDQK
jgi:hypothetical protein